MTEQPKNLETVREELARSDVMSAIGYAEGVLQEQRTPICNKAAERLAAAAKELQQIVYGDDA